MNTTITEFSTSDYLYAMDNNWLILKQGDRPCGFVFYQQLIFNNKFITGSALYPFSSDIHGAKIFDRESLDTALESLETFKNIFNIELKVAYLVPNDYPLETR